MIEANSVHATLNVEGYLNEELARDSSLTARLENIVRRLSAKGSGWRAPSAAQAADGRIVEFLRGATLPESPVGVLSVSIGELPYLYYLDGEPVLFQLSLIDRDGNRLSARIEKARALIEGLPLTDETVMLSLEVLRSEWCFSNCIHPLSQQTPLSLKAIGFGQLQNLEMQSDAHALDFLRPFSLPKSFHLVIQKQKLDPNRNSDPKSSLISPTDSEPMVAASGTLSFPEGDAKSSITVGGAGEFTIVALIADSDLRQILLATRADTDQAIGVYNGDGSMFIAASNSWARINIHLQAASAETELRYQVFAASANGYPGVPFAVWLANQAAVSEDDSGVTSSSDKIRGRIEFIFDSLDVTLSDENISFVARPEVRTYLKKLGETLKPGSAQQHP